MTQNGVRDLLWHTQFSMRNLKGLIKVFDVVLWLQFFEAN